MPTCYLHLGTHKTGTTSIQSFAYRNRRRLQDDGVLYPDYEPFLEQKKGVLSHHRFARAVVGLDPCLDRNAAEQLAAHWLETCARTGTALFLSAENMSVLEDKRCAGDKRVCYWRELKELLAGFRILPVLTLRRQDQYIESFYKERVRNIFGHRPVSFEEYFSLKLARGGMADYGRSIESILGVFGSILPLSFHDLAQGDFAVEFMQQALGVDASGYEQVSNERPSLSPVATAVKVEVSADIRDKRENALFVEWLLSPAFASLASRFVDGERKVSLFRDSSQQRRLVHMFANDNASILASHGITFPEPADVIDRPPLPALPGELVDLCNDALEAIRAGLAERA